MEIIQSFNNFIETSYNIVENANKIIFNKLHKNKEILNYTNHSTTLIIYIHGKGGSPQESQLLYNHLPKNINFYAPFLNTANTSIEDDSTFLFNKINDKFNILYLTNIILIGYSKGGTIALYFANQYHNKCNISKIITISSPLNGTKLSSFSDQTNIKNELKYDNELLQNLIYLSKNNHLKIYNIVLIKDFVVLPITSQYLTYAKDVYFINDNVSHYGIMYYDNTIKQILLWL